MDKIFKCKILNRIRGNLVRTIDEGLFSCLNEEDFLALHEKYFTNEHGNLICPYSGIELNQDNFIFEHIHPVSSGGGTLLFNCCLASSLVNGKNEKSDKHLLEWWPDKKEYYSKERLKTLVEYMLEGYKLMFFSEYELNEEYYKEIFISQEELDKASESDQEDLSINSIKDNKKLNKKEAINHGTFLSNLIQQLKKEYPEEELKDILDTFEKLSKGVKAFKELNKYTRIQNCLQEVIKEYTEEKSSSYITYTRDMDIILLTKSINLKELKTDEQIKQEIKDRLENIKQLIISSDIKKEMIDYFKSLKDLDSDNILYKKISQITEEEKQRFIENIKLGVESKITIFINMLNKGNSNILKTENNPELFEGTTRPVGYFWSNHKDKIIQKLFVEEKDNPEYETARQTILDKYKVSSYEELLITYEDRIKIFMSMLNEGNSDVLKDRNTKEFEGTTIPVGQFWSSNKDKIIQKLFVEENGNPEYETARQTILDKYKVSSYEELLNKLQERSENKKQSTEISVEDKITIFINMLNKGNDNILKDRNTELFEGTTIPAKRFWNVYKDKIIQKLFVEETNNPEYETARQTILNKYKVSSYEELLNKLQENSENKKQSQSISVEDRITIFISMLNQDNNSNILNYNNTEFFEGTTIPIGYFWSKNKNRNKIIQKLFVEENDNPEYERARQTILDKYKVSSYEELLNKLQENSESRSILSKEKTNIFINMLNEGNSDVLKDRNTKEFDGTTIPIGQFWQRNKDKIIQKLFVEEKGNLEYETARQTILDYYNVRTFEELLNKLQENSENQKQSQSISVEEKTKIFINMLNKGNSNILNRKNTEVFEGTTISVGKFWSINKNRNKIIQKLFVEEKNNPEYETARQTIFKKYDEGDIHNYDDLLTKLGFEHLMYELSETRKMGIDRVNELNVIENSLTDEVNVGRMA